MCQRSNYNDECQLFLAQSSIPNAGIGVYTAKAHKTMESVGENDMLIPVKHLPEDLEWLIDDVEWTSDLDPRLTYDADEIGIFIPGFGAQINCHFGLNNVYHGKPKYDSAGLHRSKDPGAGAFTYWYNMPNFATRDIVAGEELFLDYGYSYFDTRVYLIGHIPRAEDFNRADSIVRQAKELYAKSQTANEKRNPSDDASALTDLWLVIRNASNQALERALPQRYEDLDDTISHGAARHSVGGKSSIRSKEWLSQNGMCIDHMYVNISTIPQAGRGAFAKRFLPQGAIVSPVPVLQLNGTLAESYGSLGLLRNYGFGHQDSNIFLLPYSSVVNFINHNHENPNVKLRWSNSSFHRKDFLNLTAQELLKQEFGLLMEFVALRDIEPHEEIVFDYGAGWDIAWKKHVQHWSPPPGSENYKVAEVVMKELGILTEEEQEVNPYPETVHTACRFKATDDTIFERITKDGLDDNVTVTTLWSWNDQHHTCLRLCRILGRYDTHTSGNIFYDAKLVPEEEHNNEDCVLPHYKEIYINQIPAEAVTLVDHKMSRDQYLPNAFRHYIELPTDLLPSSWRKNRLPLASKKNYSDKCELYIAQSSIPNSGIGVYTSVAYREGDHIGEGEMLIPIISQTDSWLVNDVEWGLEFDERLYAEDDGLYSYSVFCPGFGAQVNCHFGLNNVDHGKPKFNSAGLHRSKDPGVGAFTEWYDTPNIASRYIQPGEELFVFYGYGWFDSRRHEMGDIPNEDDFKHADHLMHKVLSIPTANQANRKNFKPRKNDALEGLWAMVRNISSPALQIALPLRYDELQKATKYGASRHSVGGLSSIRSQEWLDTNGICIDNLYVDMSTIPQAGRGAFAKRFLPKDSVVAPAPVLQVNITDAERGRQLLYNYVYGHPESQVALVVYSSTVNFINHDSSNPNVKLQWSSSPLHKKEFLHHSAENVLNASFGLVLEFVALRDIYPDEEILFNYGVEWELEWKKHVEQWSPIEDSENYVSAEDAIGLMGILTLEEQKKNPYPDNVHTACYFSRTEDTSYEDITMEGDPILTYRAKWTESNRGCLRRCSILGRSSETISGQTFYDALVEHHNHHDSECNIPENEKIYVTEIPSDAVTLIDKLSSRNQHLPNTFRHYIQLSDELYPMSWRHNMTSSAGK